MAWAGHKKDKMPILLLRIYSTFGNFFYVFFFLKFPFPILLRASEGGSKVVYGLEISQKNEKATSEIRKSRAAFSDMKKRGSRDIKYAAGGCTACL